MNSAFRNASLRQLLELCLGYFGFYVLTGLAVKYFTDLAPDRLTQIAFLVNNTLGSTLFVLLIVAVLRWDRLLPHGFFSRANAPVIASGICTAVVIPTTTLMYLLPISVMVAMVIMRGSIIVVSRIVDEIQIRKGLLKKRVSWEEELAVCFALLAIGMNLLVPAKGKFEFVSNPAAMTILGAYITAYFVRLYIMNFYKNSQGAAQKFDNRAFFTLEQFSATATLLVVALAVALSPAALGIEARPVLEFRDASFSPSFWPMVSGIAYGMVAFFSVFIFMFRGRTATFAGLVNRMTSLVAGTVSTLLLAVFFGTRFPSQVEWLSLLWIGAAVALLARTEFKKSAPVKKKDEALAPAF